MWPDFMTRETLAKRLDLKPAAVDQYVKRGCLPPARKVGDALLWSWSEVDTFIRTGKAGEVVDDPYMRGLDAAKAAASRAHGQKQDRAAVSVPAAPSVHD